MPRHSAADDKVAADRERLAADEAAAKSEDAKDSSDVVDASDVRPDEGKSGLTEAPPSKESVQASRDAKQANVERVSDNPANQPLSGPNDPSAQRDPAIAAAGPSLEGTVPNSVLAEKGRNFTAGDDDIEVKRGFVRRAVVVEE